MFEVSCLVCLKENKWGFCLVEKAQKELIHTDLCGPIDPITKDDKKYIMTAFDDILRYLWKITEI